jgi:cellobiose-specific phosphotransferase system component IIC
MIRTELNQQGWSSVDYLVQFMKNLANTVTFFPVRLLDTRILSLPALMVGFMLLISSVILIRRRRKQTGPERSIAEHFCFVLLASAVLFVLAHTLRAVYMRGWYYMSLYPILLLCGATLARNLFEERNIQRLAIVFLSIIAVISVHGLLGFRQGETDKFRMVQMMNSVLHQGARVGSGNSGVYGYFFEKGIVIGLDGLVNNIAYESIRARDLEGYCSKVGITHLVDPIAGFERMAKYWNAEQTNPLSALRIIHMVPGRLPADAIALGQLKPLKAP